MKLQIELHFTEASVDKAHLEEHLRREATLQLFTERKIPAGKAVRELRLGRMEFMEPLQQRGIQYVLYTAEDWEADGARLMNSRDGERERVAWLFRIASSSTAGIPFCRQGWIKNFVASSCESIKRRFGLRKQTHSVNV